MNNTTHDFAVPINCNACNGTGDGRRLVNNKGVFSVESCQCPKCEGHGIYDLLGPKRWITVKCEPNIDQLFVLDDNLWDSWINDSLKSLSVSNRTTSKDFSHWFYDMKWP